MKKCCNLRLLILASLILFTFPNGYSQDNLKLKRIITSKIKDWKNPFPEWSSIAKPKIDSVKIDKVPQVITFYYAPGLSYYPIRESSYNVLINSLHETLGRKFRKYKIEVRTNNYSLNQLVPNIFRSSFTVDSLRIPPKLANKPVLVQKLNAPELTKALSGKSIALWHSHGYYFEMKLDRWEWQRARLFGTVEDVSIMGYVQPYLTKMLENSGANVFMPRERDLQIHEVIVDNDKSTGTSEVVLHINNNVSNISNGFLLKDTLFSGENPFKLGTSLRIRNDSAIYIPEIPEKGYYAVYISYPVRNDNNESVKYSVNHTGGITEYVINQTIGGETWIYLGTFNFNAGKNIDAGSVKIMGLNNKSGYIALDAIKFGGGMGNVARRPSSQISDNQKSVGASGNTLPQNNLQENPVFGWKLSGKPRFLEAARYYLQYAGMPDTLVYSPNNYKNDYNDDYMSRGAWINYLMASPSKPDGNNVAAGLGIPIDLSFAFHTDAGVTPDDSVIGTLAIYSTGSGNGKFPDGTSRLASRDLSDIIQTQVVEDIRTIFDLKWTRRGTWDRPYSEARKPDVPSMLLELLSHQNLADQKYGLDPRFRFQVSRSVYIGMLKYLSFADNREYVVQPLPVVNLAITPLSGKSIRLSWEPVTDPNEPTSKPDKYMIYKRTADNGFENGVVVDKAFAELELDSYDTIYSFKITALNEGGESFDSEVLSVGLRNNDLNPVLVVNAFDRISGPAWFDENKMAGVAWWQDRGVADHFDIGAVGDQYDFNRESPWLDDDSPGWGASYADAEGKIIPGNSFDYPYIHGKAIMAAGHSFFSVSDEYFCSDNSTTSKFKIVDLIFGEEKSTPFFNDSSRIDFRIYTPDFMNKITTLTESGTSIFMSGAYIGSDLNIPDDSAAIKFAGKYLHFMPRTGHAVKNGSVYPTDYVKPLLTTSLKFNSGYSEQIYSVEAPDAIEPSGKGSLCALRYSENNASAGVLFKGSYKTMILGFPFETINSESERNLFMKQVLTFFEKQ